MSQDQTAQQGGEVKNIDPGAPAHEAPPVDTAVETAAEAEAKQNFVDGQDAGEQVVEEESTNAPEPEPAPVEVVKQEETVKETAAPEAPAAPAVSAVAPATISVAAAVVTQQEESEQGDLSEEEAYLAKIREGGTDTQKRVLNAIDLYCERFRHRAPVDPEQGVKWQYEFLIHVLKLINSDYETFKGGWNALLVFFKLNHGRSSVSNKSPISDGPSSRFGPNWERGEESWNAYRNILELLRATRDPATRKDAVKNIVFERIAPGQGLINDEGLRNLRRFYQ